MLAGAKSKRAPKIDLNSRAIGIAAIDPSTTSLPNVEIETKPPARKMTVAKTFKCGCLSARRPPNQYPRLSAARITPIRLVQIYVDVPR